MFWVMWEQRAAPLECSRVGRLRLLHCSNMLAKIQQTCARPEADPLDECHTCPRQAHHQCACTTASTVVIPAIIEPVIPISAAVLRGNSRLISEAMKIAATGRAMTK